MRVDFLQPALPRYRVPFFRTLASTTGYDIVVWHGSLPGLTNARPDGFEARLLGAQCALGPVFIVPDQLSVAVSSEADLIVLSWNLRDLSLIPALVFRRFQAKDTLLWGHGVSQDDTWTRLLARRVPSLLATATVVYHPSDRRRLVAAGWRPEATFCAPNSLDLEKIAAARVERCEGLSAARSVLGLEPTFLVLHVARLLEANRLDQFFVAMKRLLTQGRDIGAIIVGEGPAEASLRAQCAELKLDARVCWYGPEYEEAKLATLFAAADVYCYPENAGLSLVQALGFGIPIVIACGREWHGPEYGYLKPGTNALMYQRGRPDGLAKALKTLMDHPDLGKRLSCAAINTAKRYCSLDAMVNGMVEAIHYAASSEGCRRRMAIDDGRT